MNPNGLFSEAFEAVKADPEVTQLLGSPLKGYGEDRGGHRSGRRNFVENVVIPGVPEKAGGRSSLRSVFCPSVWFFIHTVLRTIACFYNVFGSIRFNVEGPYGHGFVFAEAREGSSKGGPNRFVRGVCLRHNIFMACARALGDWIYLMVQSTKTGKTTVVHDNRNQLLDDETQS